MSHIAEEYAKSLGVRIGQPKITSHFYPVISEKFITFHTNDKKSPARHYDNWNLVIKMLKPYLSEQGIDVIQIGGKDDPIIKECDFHLLDCSFKQMIYVIGMSKLHLGIDSLPVHIASALDKKIVSLYSNLFPECSGPIWGKNSETKLLSPNFNEIKPSFSNNESVKRINEIKPEEIVCSTLDLLKIDHDLNNYQTLNIGAHFNNKIIEAIPNSPAPEGFLQKSLINLRCDYGISDEGLASWLNFRVNLMTSKKINLNFLQRYAPNIIAMTLFVEDENFDQEYLNHLDSMNIKYSLICRDNSKISSIRFEFFDWVIEEYKKYNKKDLDFSKEVCNNTFYHSNKILISNGKKYSCKAACDAGIERTEEDQKIIDNDIFWEEVEHINIYNYAKNKKDNRRRIKRE
tara:strand:+ start:32793 stop:34001 length:1209 start_codon:yes stop_codon:yes gene_type:complete